MVPYRSVLKTFQIPVPGYQIPEYLSHVMKHVLHVIILLQAFYQF